MTTDGSDHERPQRPIDLEDEAEDETSLLEADVMRFLAIIAFCLLVIFIPIVQGLSERNDARSPVTTPLPTATPSAEPSPTPSPTAATPTAAPAPPTPTATPTVRPTPTRPPLAAPTPRLLPTATRSPRPTRPPRPTTGPPPTPPFPSPSPALQHEEVDEPASWRLKFQSHEVMLALMARGSVRVTVYASGQLFEVQRRDGSAWWFEPVSRFEADATTYRMGEDNLPTQIVAGFRRQFPELASPSNLFYIEVSDTIRSNLEAFMSSNRPGTMIIREDEGVGYDR